MKNLIDQLYSIGSSGYKRVKTFARENPGQVAGLAFICAAGSVAVISRALYNLREISSVAYMAAVAGALILGVKRRRDNLRFLRKELELRKQGFNTEYSIKQ